VRELPPDPGGRVTATEVVVWTDGGARGNPGPAGYGAVVATPGGQVLAEVAEGIGWATNNVAEYRGVIAGLRRAKELGARRVRVRADSLLVVNQQKGLWKVKNAALRPLSDEAARLAGGFERVVWEHVPRERNRRADALANRAMDDQGRVEGPRQGSPDPEQLRLS
jgi:ribonuclease H / adenosylcobalamin/alpha-ribazole phosphatase